jgi:hypothetical protein
MEGLIQAGLERISNAGFCDGAISSLLKAKNSYD